MRRLSKESRYDSEQVLRAATRFFGPEGVGLAVAGRAPGCGSFEGAGGYVQVQASPAGGGSMVIVETAEWEHPAQRFLAEV